MSDTRSATITTLAELIHEQSTRPWERSCRLAEDLYDAATTDQRALLRVLAANPATVITKQDLCTALRVYSSRRVDAAAAILRRDIQQLAGARLVCNVWGVGYRLADAAAAEVSC